MVNKHVNESYDVKHDFVQTDGQQYIEMLGLIFV